MNEPNISPNLTIEDIHKIREYHYELTKNMSSKERAAFYKTGADKVQQEIEARRKSKAFRINNHSQHKENTKFPCSLAFCVLLL